MALQDFDIVEMQAIGEVAGQTMENVWFYVAVVNGVAPTLAECNDVFHNTVLSGLIAFMADTAGWTNVIAYNRTNGLDFYTSSIDYYGNAASPLLTPFAAYGFKLNRLTTATRNGSKRIGGVTEAVNDQGNLVMDLTDRQTMEEAIGATLEVGSGGNTATLTPVIVGRNPDGTLDLDRVSIVGSVTMKTVITTQNTRKVGHGT